PGQEEKPEEDRQLTGGSAVRGLPARAVRPCGAVRAPREDPAAPRSRLAARRPRRRPPTPVAGDLSRAARTAAAARGRHLLLADRDRGRRPLRQAGLGPPGSAWSPAPGALRGAGHHGPARAQAALAGTSGSAGPGSLRRVQSVSAMTASAMVAAPEAVRVQAAPRVATMGPPVAVPSGLAIMTMALRAASTMGRLTPGADDRAPCPDSTG